MKKTFRKLSVLLLVLLLVIGGSTSALAAESALTFVGGDAVIDCAPDSTYTSTDLFNGFKGVMPGDKLTQKITVTNKESRYDKLMLYMRAVAHDEQNNPLTMQGSDETLASMTDFLQQMSMVIWHGNTPIYKGPFSSANGVIGGISPDQLDGLEDNVYLGTYAYSTSTELTVQLMVPIEMDSTYAAREGEVDWIFSTVGIDDDPYVPPTPGTPSPATVTLFAAKTVNGEKAVGSDYSFVLKDASGKVLQTVKNSNGNIIFDTLSYAAAGTHVYTISEVNDGAEGVTYDKSVYTVTVKVTSDTLGNCTADVTYQKDGKDYTGTMVFTNKAEIEIVDPEVPTTGPDEPEIDIDEPETPKTDKPKTGDDTVILPYVLLLGASAVMMLLIAIKQRKQKN
ncbi:MAG: hypothetical protein IKT31_01680 [Firmicutes bacterium]|nr:hypothetical protein [Bacillota bacterium]